MYVFVFAFIPQGRRQCVYGECEYVISGGYCGQRLWWWHRRGRVLR